MPTHADSHIPDGFDELRNLILSKKCVAFIGSGISSQIYHNWHDLVNKLAETCGCHSKVTRDSPAEELLQVADDARSANQEQHYSYIGSHFGHIAKTNVLYGLLLTLPFKCYLTVNFDPLLGWEARMRKGEDTIMAYPNLDRACIKDKPICYLHGLVSEEHPPVDGTIVLSKTEFDRAYSENSPLLNFLIPTITNDPICFIGCGLREPAMKHVFTICKEHQRDRTRLASQYGGQAQAPPRFILRPDFKDPPHSSDGAALSLASQVKQEDNHLEKFDISSIRYPPLDADHTGLRQLFKKIAAMKAIRADYGFAMGGNHDL